MNKLLHYCMIMFGMMGANPLEGYTKTQVFLFTMTLTSQVTLIYLGIFYLVYKEDSITMLDITAVFETVFLMFHGGVKLVILFVKRLQVRDLLDRMDLFWKVEDIKDEQEKKEHLRYLSFVNALFALYTFVCVLTTISFTCRTFFVEGDHLSFTVYRPEWIPFQVMLWFENISCIFSIYCPIPGLDKFILTVLLLTKQQFKMLNQEIRRVFMEENSGEFDRNIKKVVDYHNFMLDFVDRINSVFSEGMLVYLFTILVSMGVQMYIVSSQNSETLIKDIIYMTNGIVQFSVCYCLTGQSVTDEAEETLDCVYSTEWYEHPTPSVKIAQIMMIARAQRKTLFLAGGIVKIDLETCLRTLRTMVSYAMFINTMEISEENSGLRK